MGQAYSAPSPLQKHMFWLASLRRFSAACPHLKVQHQKKPQAFSESSAKVKQDKPRQEKQS